MKICFLIKILYPAKQAAEKSLSMRSASLRACLRQRGIVIFLATYGTSKLVP